MDYVFEANKIICEYTSGYLQGVVAHYNTNRDMMDDMYENCAFILTGYLIEGKYTPMQYNAIRNELGKMIWGIFESYVKKEDEAEFVKLFSI